MYYSFGLIDLLLTLIYAMCALWELANPLDGIQHYYWLGLLAMFAGATLGIALFFLSY